MKVRFGFVSNSSSSSFLAYGAWIDPCENDESEDRDQDLYDCLEGFELDRWYPDGYDGPFIGKSWSSIGDDETGRQFKGKIQKELSRLMGREVECGTEKCVYPC